MPCAHNGCPHPVFQQVSLYRGLGQQAEEMIGHDYREGLEAS